MSNSKISNNKKLENYKKILKLYRCLGIENKDRDYIESIIKKIEELELNYKILTIDFDDYHLKKIESQIYQEIILLKIQIFLYLT